MTRLISSRGLEILVDDGRVEAADWRQYNESFSSKSRISLFNRYLPFAHKVARNEWIRVSDYGHSRDDCEQLASEALLQAIDKFDPTIGAPFTAFARKRIQGAIRNGLSRASEASAANSTRRRLERDRLHSLRQVNEKNSLEPFEILREIAVGIAIGFMLEETSKAEITTIPSDDPSAYDTASWNQLTEELAKRLICLPEKERFIIEYHYQKDIRFSEIAELLGLSKGRISQLHSQAINRLRSSLSRFR